MHGSNKNTDSKYKSYRLRSSDGSVSEGSKKCPYHRKSGRPINSPFRNLQASDLKSSCKKSLNEANIS
jgi:hypothetical protein